MKITSSVFEEGAMIPQKYTCKGVDVSPPLKIENVPEGTKALALICDDPDAPVGTWVHWVLFDLPPDTQELKEAIPAEKTLKNGAIHGTNDFKKFGYGGPCPPSGVHRYFFKFYALDTKLGIKVGATKKEVLAAMKGHILAEGQLMGRFTKS
jgi:Raf kinase inhibitor-like YbhB/YbcL family protein